MDSFYYFIILAAGVLSYYFYQRVLTGANPRRRIQKLGCKPVPRERNWDPVFGLDFLVKRVNQVKNHSWLEFTHRHFESLGLATCQLNILGRRLLFTIDPENLKAIHVSNFKSWGIPPNRRKRVVPFIGDGIFTNDGHAWTKSRKLLRPSFERSHLNELSMIERHTQDLMRQIPTDGSTVDLQVLFYRFTMNSATDFLLGDSSGAGFTFGNDFEAAFDRCLNKVGGAGRFLTLGTSRDIQYENDLKFVHESVDNQVQRAVEKRGATGGTNRQVFLDNLVSATDDKREIRSEILNNLMAGRDTSASMLSNTWFELSKHPDVWNRLQKEVNEAFHGLPPSPAQLQNLQYLRCIFNESMRLYPQVPENGRVALEDTVLPTGGGPDGKAPVFVAKGRVVLWGLYPLHRRKDIFGEDADSFRPERWLDQKGGEQGIQPGYGYLAFGAGPRHCMGQQFALTQASYLTVRMLQKFSIIESRDPNPWRERLALVLNSFGGCKVALSAKP